MGSVKKTAVMSKIDYSLNAYQRPNLKMPNGKTKLLLHSCCASCAGDIMEALSASDLETTIFFYNPNIHPRDEYELRKEENIRFAKKLGIPFVDADYDSDNWFERTKGQEFEPERGQRCTTCFDMRLERSVLYAHENGFPVLTSTLGVSRWKDMNQVNGCAQRATDQYEDVEYWDLNWRKNGGSQRMLEIAKREEFYQQGYCGCVYSLRDTNNWHEQNGRSKIKRGVNFYKEAHLKLDNISK